MTASTRNKISRRIRKCPHQARQVQLVRLLKGQWGLSAKQIARRMKVSVASVRRYLPILLFNKIVVINYKQNEVGARRPTHYYALKGLK